TETGRICPGTGKSARSAVIRGPTWIAGVRPFSKAGVGTEVQCLAKPKNINSSRLRVFAVE
ncbi:MAG: hypothetical protein KDI06_20575, partial [Calditrichaeota bacterium]|nr:hypothetical protein [Calditrichota bacterium]